MPLELPHLTADDAKPGAAMDFLDINAYLGWPTKTIGQAVAQPDQVLAELAPAGVTKALLWHIAQHDASPQAGNELLSSLIDAQEQLLGCWTILPPQTAEVIDDGFFRRMADNRIAALRAFPDSHKYLLNRTVFGDFLDQLSGRRIPVLLSLEKGITWPGVYQLLAEYPQLTCVLCDIGIWGVNRYTWPLLENYPNVYIESSLLSLAHEGLETTIARYGPERIIFGSNFPERCPEAAALAVLHAGIDETAKQKIAAENAQQLFDQVQL